MPVIALGAGFNSHPNNNNNNNSNNNNANFSSYMKGKNASKNTTNTSNNNNNNNNNNMMLSSSLPSAEIPGAFRKASEANKPGKQLQQQLQQQGSPTNNNNNNNDLAAQSNNNNNNNNNNGYIANEYPYVGPAATIYDKPYNTINTAQNTITTAITDQLAYLQGPIVGAGFNARTQHIQRATPQGPSVLEDDVEGKGLMVQGVDGKMYYQDLSSTM
jgi:hypothetical protein